MAVIFNITEALDNMEFNALNLPIQMSISALSEEFEANSKINSVFKIHKMDGYQDQMYDDTEMTMFKPTADLEVPGLDDFQNGYSKSWTSQIWTSAFSISKQAIEDGTHGTTTQEKVTKFTRTYYRTREEFAAAALSGALLGKFTFQVGDKKAVFDSTCNDSMDATIGGRKRPFFSQYHATPVIAKREIDDGTYKTYKVGADVNNTTSYGAVVGLTGVGSADYKSIVLATDKIGDGTILATAPQSNKYSLDKKLNIFMTSHKLAEDVSGVTGTATLSDGTGMQGRLNSYEIFEQILSVIDFNTFSNHRGYRGEREPIEGAKTIIIPSFPMWRNFVEQAISMRMLGGKYNVLVWSYLNNQIGFTEADMSMVILDKALNETDKGLMFLERKDLEISNFIDPKTKAYIWDGRARFGAGNGRFYTAAYANFGKANASAAMLTSAGVARIGTAPTDVALFDSTLIYTDNFATSHTQVSDAVASITITTAPTKTVYAANEDFDPTGMVITATFVSGATAAVTGYTWTPTKIAESGNVTISYGGKTVTQAVTVT